MQQWYQIFPKNPFLNIFAWIAFCFLPFYFIFRLTSLIEVMIGIFLFILFFTAYRLSFIKKGWVVYVSLSIAMAVSIGMSVYFGYVYFALFLAFFIGNIAHKSGFITVYIVHLVTTIAAVTILLFTQNDFILSQLPFIIITIIGVILLPFNMYYRNKHEKLETQLDDANEIISYLIVVEERQRIARDLHDTLGQKLSLIGLKSDLAQKLIKTQPARATAELHDIQQTARRALKEVRDMVSNMKGLKLEEEMIRVKQFLEAGDIECQFAGLKTPENMPLYIEHVLSMCLMETVTNVIKHSQATQCKVSIEQKTDVWEIIVADNGIGIEEKKSVHLGHGLQGMRERLEFVNGTLEISGRKGTTIIIQVPKIIGSPEQEGLS